jgi:hypothetical protein
MGAFAGILKRRLLPLFISLVPGGTKSKNPLQGFLSFALQRGKVDSHA